MFASNSLSSQKTQQLSQEPIVRSELAFKNERQGTASN